MTTGDHPTVQLALQPLPVEVRTARRALRAFLGEYDRQRLQDDAELALSEIVTNAVLHAHTPLEVRLALLGRRLRVEVEDRDPQLPVQRDYELQATTGRGMELVAALTSECGVTPTGQGKVVWFLLDDDSGTPAAEDPPRAWDVEPSRADEDGVPPGAATVVLRGLPPTLWLAAREHHDAILREYALFGAEHGAVDVEQLSQANRARGRISARLVAALEEAGEAGLAVPRLPPGHPTPLPPTPRTLDLALALPPDAQQTFLALQDVLDAAERLAVADRLLVRPGLPEVVAVRDWACEQVVAQLRGVPASPWPGTDQERFTDWVHDGGEPVEWDPAPIRDSDRGVVAADDANRIIAISRPLAEQLGWPVEELVGRRVVTIIPRHLREAHVAGFSRHLTSGESHVLGVPLRLPVLTADGTELVCDYLVEEASGTHGRRVYLAWITPLA